MNLRIFRVKSYTVSIQNIFQKSCLSSVFVAVASCLPGAGCGGGQVWVTKGTKWHCPYMSRKNCIK